MINLLLIAIGGAIGSILRFLLANSIANHTSKTFPFGTLIVNTIGGLLIGFLFTIIMERYAHIAVELRSLLLIGFLGGFTTFSTFSLETINLMSMGLYMNACLNILASVSFSLTGTWLGIMIGRTL